MGDVTLGDVMAQLQLYQVNVRVGHTARRQVTMRGFAPEATLSPPPPMAFDFEDEDADDGDDLCFASTLSLQLHHRASCSVFVISS